MPRSARPGRVLLSAACALALLPAAPAGAITAKTLHAKLAKGTAKLGASSGALVVDHDTGTVLFARRADVALSPASNEKLFTTAAALRRFGPNGTLRTRVAVPAGRAIGADGVLHGDLQLVGGGDPSLGDVALKELVADLRAAGLKQITGGVRGDESYFDSLRGSYDTNFAPDDDLGGWLGGLTWGHGRATPGGPAVVAAARLHRFLKAAGVRIGRQARAATGPLGEGAQVLASVSSPPMSRLIATTNQPSDNFYAETLVKDLGARFGGGRGTTTAGLSIVRAELAELGIRPVVRDGSGLSRADRATPRQIVTFLRAMRRSRQEAVFTASLAVPGRIGTLAARMRGTRADGACQAKTGTLRGVSALSGYCRADNGHTIVFSFLENAIDAGYAKRIEDGLVPQLVRYSG